MRRIKGVRKRLSEELGFLVSPVRIRDDLDLPAAGLPHQPARLADRQGRSPADRELAINPGHIDQQIQGMPTRDPAFNLEAVWIDPVQREEAQARGYTVVDVPTVIATHLSKVLQENAHEMLRPPGSPATARPARQVGPEARRGADAEDAAAVGGRPGAPGTAPRPDPDHQHAHDLPDAGRTRPRHPGPRGADRRTSGRRSAGPSSRSSAARHDELPVITLEPAAGTDLAGCPQGRRREAASSPRWPNGSRPSCRRRPTARKLPASRRSCWCRRRCGPGSRGSCASRCPRLKVLAYNEVPDNRRVKLVAAVAVTGCRHAT